MVHNMLAVLKACILASNDIDEYLEILNSGVKTANFMARQQIPTILRVIRITVRLQDCLCHGLAGHFENGCLFDIFSSEFIITFSLYRI